MYKYFISWRYICKRFITLLSIIGVAFGVMVLVVVLSVMDGFKTEFTSRLQGILSHLIVRVRSAEHTYPQLEKKILEIEHVKACAPHLNGMVLIGTGNYYAGGIVVGIDYNKEIEVGKLKQYIVTPYKELRLRTEKFLEENIRKRKASLSWTVVSCEEFEEKDGSVITDVLCRAVVEYKTASDDRNLPRTTRYVVFGVNSENKINYINRFVPARTVGSFPKTNDETKARWQKFFQEKADKINGRDIEAYMEFFSKKLRNTNGGLDPDNPFAYEQKSEGELAEVEPEPVRPLLVGYDMMQQLGIRRGDEIALLTGQRDLEEDNKLKAVSRKFVVVGAFKSGWQEIDIRMVYAQREDLDGFLEGNIEVSEICVSIEDYEKNADIVKDAINNVLNPNKLLTPSYPVEKWEDRRRPLLAAIRLERNVMAFILFFIVILAVATIMIILILLVAEKTKDIGILKTMGASDKGIMGIFIYNGVFISGVGSILGGTVGILISLNVNWIADRIFEFTGFRVFPRDVYHLDKIPTEVNFVNIGFIVGATLVLALVACTIPALQAARMNVVDALRSESPSIKLLVSPLALFGMLEFSKKTPNFDQSYTGNRFFGVSRLHRQYTMGDRPLEVLNGVDLEVKQGEIISILGKSGQGKSTLLNQMGLLDTPDQGMVFLQGHELNSFSLAQQAKIRGEKIGFIFQFYHLLPEFTALENVMLASMILHTPTSWMANKKEAIEYAQELLTMVGLKERMGHHPLQLSGGERQRVAIARALMNKPDIILCDEPTGNLDNETSHSIQEILWKLNREMKQTFIVVTHDEELAKSCDRIFRMKSGKILAVEKENL